MAGVLITGFEPFGGETVNPSWEVVKQLDGMIIRGQQVVAKQLPCVFGEALTVLKAALETYQPRLTIAVGQAGGRVDITVERVAINVDDARIPDNKGQQPIDEPIVANGPAACFSTLPIKAIVSALRQQGIPASVSQTAGTFVCNHVMYGLLHQLQGKAGRREVLSIFLICLNRRRPTRGRRVCRSRRYARRWKRRLPSPLNRMTMSKLAAAPPINRRMTVCRKVRRSAVRRINWRRQ